MCIVSPHPQKHTETGPDVPQQRLRRGTLRDQQRHRGREALLAHPNRPRVRRIPGTGHLPGKRTFTGPGPAGAGTRHTKAVEKRVALR